MTYKPLVKFKPLAKVKLLAKRFSLLVGRKFKAKELDAQILSKLSAFQGKCENFATHETRFAELAEEMKGLFMMAREQNEKFNLHIEETPNSNRYEISSELRISDKPNPDIRWDYKLYVLLKYSRDTKEITVSGECTAPSLRWSTSIINAGDEAFSGCLKTALLETRNFDGRDYASSPLFRKML